MAKGGTYGARLRFISLVAILAVLPAGGFAITAQNGEGEQDQGLHELAKQAGGKLVLQYIHRKLIYLDVERLALDSDLVVVGRTLGHRARLRADGKFVTKDFWVTAQSVLK